MGVKWTLHSLVPALLIVLITALLVFAMVFISSMTTAIDRMIVMLGSGNIVLYDDYDISDWEKAEKYHVTTSSGVVFSDNGKSLVNIKGIEEGYFAGERGETLKLSTIESTARNPIIVSKTLSDRMKLDFGDTMTLMVYEEEKNRARPVLVTVTGIFDSGYAQLDRYLCYVDYSLLGGEGVWEVVLEDNDVCLPQLLIDRQSQSCCLYCLSHERIRVALHQLRVGSEQLHQTGGEGAFVVLQSVLQQGLVIAVVHYRLKVLYCKRLL